MAGSLLSLDISDLGRELLGAALRLYRGGSCSSESSFGKRFDLSLPESKYNFGILNRVVKEPGFARATQPGSVLNRNFLDPQT